MWAPINPTSTLRSRATAEDGSALLLRARQDYIHFLIVILTNSGYPTSMVSMSEIREFGGRIGREFNAERVLLFGSYADGSVADDSDIDLLVIVDHQGKNWRMATQIRRRLRPQFPLDLLVRTPEQLGQRLQMGDCFFKEIAEKGTVLYEAPHR